MVWMKLSQLGLIKIELIDLNKLKFIACFKISDKYEFIINTSKI